jgi:peptidoglycan/LPS O-acetylase OafA/YrhL
LGKRIVELDGLRGVAALVVVFAHFFAESEHGIAHLQLGWLGVNIFFVLSGFLIGGIILDQANEPGFLKSFYFRRVMRIFPVYFTVFLATIFCAWLTRGHVWSDHPFPAITYATFAVNFALMNAHDWGSLWLRPAWTLAVEEQFYFVLPLLIMSMPRRYLVWVLGALWVSSLGFRVAFHVSNPIAASVLLPSRMDLLLGGVILAIVHRKCDWSRFLLFFRLNWAACIILLDVILLTGHPQFMELVSGTVASIGIASFMLAAFYGAPEGRWVRANWLRWFGQISYCLYLVHQPVNGLLHGLLLNEAPGVGSAASIAVTLAAMALSITIAAASWYWLEKPILTWAASENAKFQRREQWAPA